MPSVSIGSSGNVAGNLTASNPCNLVLDRMRACYDFSRVDTYNNNSDTIVNIAPSWDKSGLVSANRRLGNFVKRTAVGSPYEGFNVNASGGYTWSSRGGGSQATSAAYCLIHYGDAINPPSNYPDSNGNNQNLNFSMWTPSSYNTREGWTVTAWIKPSDNNAYGSMLSHSSGGPVGNSLHIASGRLAFWYYNGSWQYVQSGSLQMSNYNWYNCTWRMYYDGSTYRLSTHLNDVTDLNFDLVNDNGNESVNKIGGHWNTTSNFVGRIGMWMMWDKALTDAELTQNFNNTKSRYGY